MFLRKCPCPRALLLALCVVVSNVMWLWEPPPLWAAEADAATGTIEGVVVYRADSQRPWRQARYYVKRAKTGELAEAVVALKSRALRESPDERTAVTHTIDQKNYQFTPETIAIRAGDAVKFTNDDPQVHNVKSSGSVPEFNVNMPLGVEYTHRFDRAGGIGRPVKISCVYHGSMRAWVFVFDHPHYGVTPTNGRFRFEKVPAGTYELEMKHPAGDLAWRQQVVVRAQETTTVDIRVSPDDKVP